MGGCGSGRILSVVVVVVVVAAEMKLRDHESIGPELTFISASLP
jgi:hypothetical protein